MKKTIFTFLAFALLLSFSCEKQNIFNPEPPDELPPATMTGANTFGCLVNGEVWRPYVEGANIWESAIYAKHDRGWVGCDQLLVGATKKYFSEVDISQEISVNVWCPVIGENEISFSKGRYRDLRGCGEYYLDTLSLHTLIITKLDTINNIASGTFEFTAINDECQDTVKITQGRFDVDSSL
jgi:hypothetical protein